MTLQTRDYHLSADIADKHRVPLGTDTRHTILRTLDRRIRHLHLTEGIRKL